MMLKIVFVISVLFLLLPLILGLPELLGMFFMYALLYGGILYFCFIMVKIKYDNICWIITNKGLTQINKKNGNKTFIPTNHISSVSHVKEMVKIITTNTYQPMILSFLQNGAELKEVLDDLIYKTEKQKEVFVLGNTDSMSEIKKYKDLLDSGIITQEEFDTKKRQLLDL